MTQEVLAPAIPGITEQDVEAIAANEPSWLQERRRAAWRAYQSMDFPDPYDEEWRRTDVRALDLSGFAARRTSSPEWNLPLDPRDDIANGGAAGHVVTIDGHPAFTGHVEAEAKAGVIITSLANAVTAHRELVEKHLGSVVPADEWKYLALNAAMWSGGAFVYVPNDVEVKLPVLLTQSISGGAAFPRTLVVAGRNARVTVVDESTSTGDGFVSAAVEIVLGDGAHLEYYDVNEWGVGVNNFKTVRAILGRDAQFTALAAGMGSKLTKMRIDTEMPQPGAQAQLLGVTFGNDGQHFDYNTLQNHVGGHTISDLQFKSALTDASSLVWYGITRINPTAGGSEANQTSRNMLLSDHAKAAPIPILEIEAYDVSKCSHGATAGPVDENELFYLQARAIPRKVAEQMLVEGFFADVIERIPSERLRGRVMDAVIEKAGGQTATLSADEMLSA